MANYDIVHLNVDNLPFELQAKLFPIMQAYKPHDRIPSRTELQLEYQKKQSGSDFNMKALVEQARALEE